MIIFLQDFTPLDWRISELYLLDCHRIHKYELLFMYVHFQMSIGCNYYHMKLVLKRATTYKVDNLSFL